MKLKAPNPRPLLHSVRDHPDWWAYGLALTIVAGVYTCLAFLSLTAIADYVNGHHLFPEPWGGYAMAFAVDGCTVVAFLVFRRDPRWLPWFAGGMLLVFAFTSYWLQRLHAEHANHPLLVAAIVPASLVVVGIALHLIRPAKPTKPVGRAARVTASPRTAMPRPASEPPSVVPRETPAVEPALTGSRLVEHIIRTEGDLGNTVLAERAGVTDRTVRNVRSRLATQNGNRP